MAVPKTVLWIQIFVYDVYEAHKHAHLAYIVHVQSCVTMSNFSDCNQILVPYTVDCLLLTCLQIANVNDFVKNTH